MMHLVKLILFIQACMYWGNCFSTVAADSVFPDISYVSNAHAKQKLDLYVPAKKGFATVLYIHEGSLLGGDKDDAPYDAIARKFQQSGIGFANMNYRLGPGHVWPAQPDDVASALYWIKKNITKYGGDSSSIYIAGHSSGALLAAIVCCDTQYLAKKNIRVKEIKGFVSMGTILDHTIETGAQSQEEEKKFFQSNDYFKIFGSKKTFDNASPLLHTGKHIPRCLFIIAEEEQEQPPILAQTKLFLEKVMPLGVQASYRVIPGRNHMSNMKRMTEPGDPVFSLILNFLNE